MAAVVDRHHRFRDDRLRKARPARPGIELRARVEQCRAAGGTPVDAVVVAVPVLAREGPLRAGAPHDGELLGRELRPPLIVRLHHFGVGSAHATSLRRRALPACRRRSPPPVRLSAPWRAPWGRWLRRAPVLYWPVD